MPSFVNPQSPQQPSVVLPLAGYLLHSGDPNMLWSPDHGILAYLTNDS